MKRVYNKYIDWEDFKNGMFSNKKEEFEKMVNESFFLLTNLDFFEKACFNVLEKWPISSIENLTNTSQNRKAWIGQASCSYKYGSTESATKKAWFRMSEIEKHKANIVAERAIKTYEAKNRGLYKNMGNEMLF